MNRNLYTDAIADDHIYVREEGRLTVKSNYVWEGSFRNAERLLSWRIAGGEQGRPINNSRDQHQFRENAQFLF